MLCRVKPLFSKRTLGPGVRRMLLLAGPLLRRWARAGYFGGRLEQPPERILLLACGGVTESLWAGQVVAPLLDRFGSEAVSAACRQETAPLWQGWLGPDRVRVLPGLEREPPLAMGALWELSSPLRDGGYDVACDLTGNRQTALLAFLARPRRAFGCGGDELASLLSARPALLPPAAHLARRSWTALAPLLGEPPSGSELRLPPVSLEPSPSRGAVRAALNLPKGQPYAVLIPGMGPPALRWPVEHFAVLAEQLEAELGLIPVALGARHERRLLEATVHRSPHGKVALDLPLPHMARLLERARLVVGGDVPAVHLGAAVGAPVVALYNATDPQVRRPLGPRVRVLATGCPHRTRDLDVDAVPRRGCPSAACWEPLPPERALPACRSQLLA